MYLYLKIVFNGILYLETKTIYTIRFFRTKFLFGALFFIIHVVHGFAQEPATKSIYDQFDRLLKVGSGDRIELKVGEFIGIYSDTDDIVNRYDATFDGAYLNSAHVYFSDGTTNNSTDSKYIQISHTNPKEDLNGLYGLKPTSGYVDMIIYYVIVYWDSKGREHLASGQYTFKVKVVGKNGEGSSVLKKISLPNEITIREYYDYLLTPTIEPADAVTGYTWKSSDQGVAFALSGKTAIELGQGKYSSENVELYMTEKDCCIRARNAGVATVTVTTDEGLTASVKVNVIPFEIHNGDINDILEDIYSIVEDSLKR